MSAQLYTTSFYSGKKETTVYTVGMIPDTKEVEFEVVNLYPQAVYQTWEGFGGALTESSGYTLSRMGEKAYNEVVAAYYGKEGIGYTLGRVPLDSCDFSLDNFSAVTDATDTTFQSFSLERDARYVQPLLKKVQALAAEPVDLLMSPWSPPVFMKTTGVRNGGGRLIKEHYGSWARYICKYLQEYRKLGFKISMLSIQNEPLAVTPWDSCQYSGAEEKAFLRDHLYPEMKAQGLDDIDIYIWDHNKERVFERAQEILDETTSPMVAGIAFHWYTGDHFDAVQLTHDAFPDKKLMHSEGCAEYAVLGDGDALGKAEKYAHEIIGDMNAGMNRFIDWNIVLDEKGGPNHVHNYCAAPVMCDTVGGEIQYQPSFAYIAHFSKFIKPGAVRIGHSRYDERIEMTAFQNTNGQLIAVMLNRSEKALPLRCRVQGKICQLLLPAHAIATLVIDE